MKKFSVLALVAVVAAVCACKEEKVVDPFQEALTAELQKQFIEDFVSVEFQLFEKIDSSTYNDELLRRKKVFEVKAEQDEILYNKYVGEKKPKNASIQHEKVLKDRTVLVKLDSLAESFGSHAEDIAFYDFHFSVLAKGKSAVMKLDDAYACITPSYEVVGLTTDQRDIHKATGKAVPGYLDIIKDDNE